MTTDIDLALKPMVDENLSYNLKIDILKKYSEPWRFYHNFSHVQNLFSKLDTKCRFWNLSPKEILKFRLAILFHDVVYYPWSLTNEQDSAEYFLETYKKHTVDTFEEDYITSEDALEIYNAILCTKWGTSLEQKPKWFKCLIEIDQEILKSKHNDLVKYEDKIFKENQFLSSSIYNENRCSFLDSAMYTVNLGSGLNLSELKTHVNNRNYKVGIYCGTFDPFTKGHFNILQQAERVFDKVIIAIGQNPSKPRPSREDIIKRMEFIFKSAPGREIIFYSGLITELVTSRPEHVTLIRGLRNATDLASEDVLHTFAKDLQGPKEVNFAYFKCEKKYEHISSSQLRPLLASSAKEYVEKNYLTYNENIPVTDILRSYWEQNIEK